MQRHAGRSRALSFSIDSAPHCTDTSQQKPGIQLSPSGLGSLSGLVGRGLSGTKISGSAERRFLFGLKFFCFEDSGRVLCAGQPLVQGPPCLRAQYDCQLRVLRTCIQRIEKFAFASPHRYSHHAAPRAKCNAEDPLRQHHEQNGARTNIRGSHGTPRYRDTLRLHQISHQPPLRWMHHVVCCGVEDHETQIPQRKAEPVAVGASHTDRLGNVGVLFAVVVQRGQTHLRSVVLRASVPECVKPSVSQKALSGQQINVSMNRLGVCVCCGVCAVCYRGHPFYGACPRILRYPRNG